MDRSVLRSAKVNIYIWLLLWFKVGSGTHRHSHDGVETLSSHGAKQIIHLMSSALAIRPFTENRELTTRLPSPSSHVTPKKTWSLVVSQTEESTSKLRAVPKVSMLLSAMEEAHRRQQAVLVNGGRTWACKNDKIIKNGKNQMAQNGHIKRVNMADGLLSCV